MEDALDKLLAEKFSNGFRYNSEMEIGRMRKFISERLGKDIAPSDFLPLINLRGTEFKGKHYFVCSSVKEKIVEMAKNYFDSGAKVIFYEGFYAKHREWFMKASVVSAEMLKVLFQEGLPLLMYSSAYFGYLKDTVKNVLEIEVYRAWGNETLLDYDRLAERLMYVPKWRIEQLLGTCSGFIWNSRGEYMRLSNFSISEDEIEEIRRFAANKIRNDGYAAMKDLPIEVLRERNFELSQTALEACVFQICLADEYMLRGKIVAPKGDNINVQALLENYCCSLDKCTLDELVELEREITGVNRPFIPLQVGYDTMVRIDKNNFVADRHVSFDVQAIDMAIEYFMNSGDYVPIKSITTFAMFPACGHHWSLFLLESYCRRFSATFRFDAPAPNSQNAGAIIRKNCVHESYVHIMADAVSKSDTPLNEASALRFLYDLGYIGKRTNSKIGTIINLAKAKRSLMP